MHAKACDEKQLSFQEKIDKHEKSGTDIVYLDESGHAHSQIRTHGYAKRGKRCIGTHNWGERGRTNVIGALLGKILFAVGLFDCNIDSVVFLSWIRQLLLPSLKKPSVIVMDNASFHKNAQVFELLNSHGHIVEFLPPYSPQLNPIEHLWAQKKAYRGKHQCSIEQCYA